MQAQAEVVRNITVDQGRREKRLAEIKAEISESCEEIDNANKDMKFAIADRKAAVKRLDKARKELATFVELNMDFVAVVK